MAFQGKMAVLGSTDSIQRDSILCSQYFDGTVKTRDDNMTHEFYDWIKGFATGIVFMFIIYLIFGK